MKPIFNIGQTVFYTNPNGVKWGEKTVIGITSWYGDDVRYYISPSDSPWYPVDETCLTEIDRAKEQELDAQRIISEA